MTSPATVKSPYDSEYNLTGGPVRRAALLIGRGARAHRGWFTLALIFSVTYGVATVAVGWALGHVTDTVVIPAITESDYSRASLWGGAALILGIGVINSVSVAARRIFAAFVTQGVQAGHRKVVTRQYLDLAPAWHRRHPTGRLLSNAGSDAEAASSVFNPLPFAIGVCAMLLVAGGVMVNADPVLGAIGIAMIPLVMVANVVFRRYMTPAVTRAQAERANVSATAHESFDAGLLVKALGTANQEIARFDEATLRLRDANVRAGTIRSVFDPVIDLIPTATTLVVLAVGTYRLGQGEVEAGSVVLIAYLLTIMQFPVRAIGFVLGELPRSMAGYERIAAVARAAEYLPEGQREHHGSAGASVHLHNLGYSVSEPDDVQILTQIEYQLRAGSTVAVVGATGSGKSTLCDLLARVDDPTVGYIEFDGADLRSIDEGSRTQLIAYVPQQVFIFENTVRYNVTLGNESFTDEQINAALERAHATEFVSELSEGVDTVIGESGANLSGGQRQRLAIARALVRQPALLILDDATSAVDPLVEQQILGGLRDGRTTVFMVAYRSAAIAMADDVIHVAHGQVAAVGSHSELLDRDAAYAAVVAAYSQDRAADGEPDGSGELR